MLSKRIIPTFLLKGNRLVKGTNFGDFIDVGDPVSQAMICDAQGADEIIIVDIDASLEGRFINPDVITRIITKCRLPITAGGGIKSIDDARICFKAGADKIVVNTHAILNPSLVSELSQEFGSQSVVVSIDVMKNLNNGYDVFTHSGKEKTDLNLDELINKFIENGAGEFIIKSIDQDGTLSGFDLDLFNSVRKITSVPLIASGGAGSYDHLVDVLNLGCDAATIGKMLFLRDYDIVRIKSYLIGKKVVIREA